MKSFLNTFGNIKIIIAVAVIIAILIIGILVALNSNKDKTVKTIEQEPYEYFTMYSLDEKVGVIDKQGKTIIENKYTNIYIPNQSKDVFFCFTKTLLFIFFTLLSIKSAFSLHILLFR